MSTGSLLGIGTSALQAFRSALNTTGHNIANANTPGYSRQRVDLTSSTPQYAGYGYIGTGVHTDSVQRIYNSFVDSQVRNYTASASEFQTFHHYATQIDNVLADPDAGLSTAMQRFYSAAQDLSNDPGSTAARQAMISEGQGLVERFHSLGGWLGDMGAQVNSELKASVTDINRISSGIAELNEKIVFAYGVANQQPPNDLLDQRDQLVRDLSEHVSVTTLTQDDGAMNVMIGTGQTLVVANTTTELTTYRGAGMNGPLQIALQAGANGQVPITDQLSGGKIGGLLGFRERVLEPALNELGRTAIGLGEFFNAQHQSGTDLNGELGQAFFSFPDPQWDAHPGVSSSLSVAWGDISQLSGANYKLQYDGAAWALSRTDTGEAVTMAGSGTAGDPFVVDGMRITVDAAAAGGDTFLIQPTHSGAQSLQMLLNDPSRIAAASPILSAAATANNGSGIISAGKITDIGNPAFQASPGSLTPPVMIRFTGATTYEVYDNSNPASPSLLETVSGYDPATGGEVFPTPGGLDYGYQVKLTGSPASGDEFTLGYNSNGDGDNRNALALGQVLTGNIMGNGAESLSDVYRSMVSEVGTTTRQAEVASGAHQQLLERSLNARDSISGVNLDEEAANLIKYQQSYQAAAQVIAAANEMFNALLGAVRR